MFLKKAYQGNNQWYLYLATLILVVVGTIIGQIPLLVVLLMKAGADGMDEAGMQTMLESMDFSSVGLDTNLTVFLILLAFVFGLIFLWLGVRFIHNKPFKSIISPKSSINWNKIIFGFGLWMLLTIILETIFYLSQPDIYSLQFDASKFIVLLIITLLVLPFQTSFEELLFRGYLMQGISLISKYRWIPLLITSVSFGLMHFANPEVQEFGVGLSMTYYIGVGLFLGIITLLDDSLELALGIHAATNIYGALFVTFDASAIQTPALFHVSEINMGLMLVGFFIAALIFTLIAARKYKWQDWTKFYCEIEKPHPVDQIVLDNETFDKL